MAPYRNLIVWQKAHQLVLRIYAVSREWPDDERFGLTSQIRRAAVSIPANVAEGSAKKGSKEFRRYLDIAAGSHAEVEYMLQLAADLEYAHMSDGGLLKQTDEVGRLLWGLHRSIRNAP
jgi:four helix bundle protein